VLDLSEVGIEPVSTESSDDEPTKVKRDVDVEVNGRRYAVSMWVPDVPMATGGGAVAVAPRPRRSSSGGGGSAAGAGKITSPMQGTVFKLPVNVGDEVTEGQTICVLEAMKMENNIAADKAGTIVELKVEAGQSVSAGDLIAVIE